MSLRLNAVKHGILSKEAVLPHESKDEFEDLLAQYDFSQVCERSSQWCELRYSQVQTAH